MSSSATLKFDEPISLKDWQTFCRKYHLDYRTDLARKNVFQVGEVEVSFGRQNAVPPTEADEILIATYAMADVEGVARITARIWLCWGGSLTADPEIKRELLGALAAENDPMVVEGHVVRRALSSSGD